MEVDVVRALCSPPWNFSPNRAWAIVEEYHLTLEGLARWTQFAAEKSQRLAAYLISKQALPPVEKTAVQKILEAK